MKKLIRICAWCPGKENKHQKAKEKGQIVTDGICKDCVKKVFNF